MRRNLNICLHNVVSRYSDISSIYDVTTTQLLNLNELIQRSLGVSYDTYTLYFDDGYKSFKDIVCGLDLGVSNKYIRTAIIIEQIGMSEKLSIDEIKDMHAQGYGIDSHGMSHAALAIFKDKKLLPTMSGGSYENSAYGTKRQLSEQEVLFQIIESKLFLEEKLHSRFDNFVLPHGLYNGQTVRIITSKTDYQRILTCHSAIDTGQVLSPRLLITQENINKIDHTLKNLTDNYQLLADVL